MPSPSPFATNSFGVRVNPLALDMEGSPTAQTYHGLSIVANGNVIGRITNFGKEAYSREGTHIREINHRTFGRPVDYVPGISTGYTFTAQRVEIWRQELEVALGWGAVWNDLADQNHPFKVQEFLYRGTVPYRVWTYFGCWFREKNSDEATAEGDAIIRVNCTVAYVSRLKTLG